MGVYVHQRFYPKNCPSPLKFPKGDTPFIIKQ